MHLETEKIEYWKVRDEYSISDICIAFEIGVLEKSVLQDRNQQYQHWQILIKIKSSN